jgi:hypothetical protein
MDAMFRGLAPFISQLCRYDSVPGLGFCDSVGPTKQESNPLKFIYCPSDVDEWQ